MSLLALAAFSGTAEILGTPKPVSFQNSALTIGNVTLDEAKMLLEALAAGQVKSAELWSAAHSGMNDLLSASAEGGKRDAAVPPSAAVPLKSAPTSAARPASPPAVETPKTAPAVAATAPAVATTGANGISAEPKTPVVAAADDAEKPRRGRPPSTTKGTTPASPAAVSAALKAAEEPDTAAGEASAPPAEKKPAGTPLAGGLAELTAKLAKMQRLRDIVGEIHSAGYDDAKKILAVCEQLQEQVPVLKRATDLSTRVPKIAASFGITI